MLLKILDKTSSLWFVLDFNSLIGLVIVDLGCANNFSLNRLSLVGTGFWCYI